MDKIFSTVAVDPRDRFDYWHSVACQAMVPHDSRPACRQTFGAELEVGKLAALDLFRFRNSEMTVSYAARHISRADAGQLFVCRQMAGALILGQYGREVLLKAGEIALLDPSAPYTGHFMHGSELLLLSIPRRLLEARVGRAQDLAARAIHSARGSSALTASFLGMLPEHVGELGAGAGELVQEQALDLIAFSIGESIGRERAAGSSARAVVLMKVRAAIEARLTDPRLDAQEVAAVAGVSVRYANAVLADIGTSIQRLIQSERLDRCRRALADRTQSHRTVSDIAYGWGFSDMTHFGRKFKAAFGMVPREYRMREASKP